MKQEDETHYKDAPVQYRTDISGWVDKNGRFWGSDEHMARWSSCGILDCGTDGCGNTVKRNSFMICDCCREEKRKKKFAALERIEWDGSTPLYSDSHDEYFFDADCLSDYIYENECTIEDMDLVICKSIHISTLDGSSLIEGLHEDAELPDEIATAVDALNDAILKHGKAQSWEPSKLAAIVNIDK